MFFVNKITARRISPTDGVWSAIQRLVFGDGFQIGFGIEAQEAEKAAVEAANKRSSKKSKRTRK